MFGAKHFDEGHGVHRWSLWGKIHWGHSRYGRWLYLPVLGVWRQLDMPIPIAGTILTERTLTLFFRYRWLFLEEQVGRRGLLPFGRWEFTKVNPKFVKIEFGV